jgi:hypothetical protein
MRKPMSNALDIDFAGGLTREVTPHAGVGLLVELGRRSGVVAAAAKYLPAKKSAKGLGQDQMVEAFVLLSALGGDCLDDFEGLRRDYGLAAMVGYHLPAAATARQWLDQFHDATALAERPQHGSFIPRESDRLAGLRAVLRHCLLSYVVTQKPGPELTLDVDAHLVESAKETALPTYEGYRGYQPLLVSWAETGLVLADEFRDGNVPASKDTARVVDEAYESLPAREGGWQVSVRSDSAAYEQAVLDHWAERGWRFAVSADMSRQLKAAIEALPPQAWHAWQVETKGYVREWAEVAFVPTRLPERRDLQPYRYLAIRIRPPQGLLFGDGSSARHFAVVTNDWQTDGQTLLQWHRGKAGTIEHVHRLLKDELAAGVYPSAKFGANAAWLRLQVLTLNLLELLKASALDGTYRQARPKRLRFAIFTQFGRVVRHARQQVLRIATRTWQNLVQPGRLRLAALAWATP